MGSRPAKEPGTTRAAVYRYSGRRWVPVEGPSIAGSDALSAVDALPDGTVLAVGWKDVDLQTGNPRDPRHHLPARGVTGPVRRARVR